MSFVLKKIIFPFITRPETKMTDVSFFSPKSGLHRPGPPAPVAAGRAPCGLALASAPSPVVAIASVVSLTFGPAETRVIEPCATWA
jgi:hypothetical protein